MSVWTREVCKVGVTIQGYTSQPGNGWMSTAMKGSAMSVPNNATTLGNHVSKPAARWASDMMLNKFVLERTKMWGYTRNPINTGGGDYSLDFDLHGGTNTVAITAIMMHIWRASDKGMDQGATAGYMRWKDIQIYDERGVLVHRLLDDGANEVDFAEWAWQNTRLAMDFAYTHSAPIGRVYVHFYIGPGYYAAHDIGDRSPGYGFNPSITFGKYYPRNLNEISADAVGIQEDAATGYLRPLLENWSYGNWWWSASILNKNQAVDIGNWELASMPIARTLHFNTLTLQGYKDKYSPHAHVHLYVYVDGVEKLHVDWYPYGGSAPSGWTLRTVDSANRIYKITANVSIPFPAAARLLRIRVVATNSNEETPAAGFTSAYTTFD